LKSILLFSFVIALPAALITSFAGIVLGVGNFAVAGIFIIGILRLVSVLPLGRGKV
jgi:hypothetical protein